MIINASPELHKHEMQHSSRAAFVALRILVMSCRKATAVFRGSLSAVERRTSGLYKVSARTGCSERVRKRPRKGLTMADLDVDGKIFVGKSEKPEFLTLHFANRHGLVTGALEEVVSGCR